MLEPFAVPAEPVIVWLVAEAAGTDLIGAAVAFAVNDVEGVFAEADAVSHGPRP